MNIFAIREKGRRGQSLVEILVALGIGVILIGGVTALISVNLRSSSESKMTQLATSLIQEVAEGAKAKADADWEGLYGLGKGVANKYHIASSTRVITAGTEIMNVGGFNFTRYFYIENVNRTQCGTGSPTTTATTGVCNNSFPDSDIAEDPSTQKINTIVEWAGGKNVTQAQYVSRKGSAALRQTDWSGGSGDNSILISPNEKYSVATNVDTATTSGAIVMILTTGGGAPMVPNIDGGAANHWAWNDTIGWIDFGYAAGAVGVNNEKLFGYASSSVGLIAFDCATTPNGNICGGAAGDWKVSVAGSALQGWAYSDAIGWISFDSVTASAATGQPSASYGVTIDGSGNFSGFAYNDAIGWISFNCSNQSTCAAQGEYDYKVKTAWTSSSDTGSLVSPIFDLGGQGTINSVIWKGIANGGGVRFQIAASDVSTGPWADANYKGPGGTSGTEYAANGPDVVTPLSPKDFSSVRYVRYKIILESNAGRTNGPEVRDIILNYSQ